MLDLLTLPFFQRAIVIGLILGFVMALLGVIVVLRKMSFFADALGHSALTGIALGVLLSINPFAAALAFVVLVAIGMTIARRISSQSFDTLLGVFFAASVALGVILVSLSPGYQADLVSFLFGNILTVTDLDIALSASLAVLVIIVLWLTGKSLVAITLDPALAKAEGIAVERHEFIFLILLATVIALAIKFIGIILVSAMLIIPAAAAQNMSRTLLSMFAWSAAVGVLSVLGGMLASASFNWPSGPSIVLVSTGLFTASLFSRAWRT